MNGNFSPGCRVRLKVDLHILAADLVPAGVTGTVVAGTPERFVVRLDDRRPGLDRWANEVRLYPGDTPDHDLAALAWLLFEPLGENVLVATEPTPSARFNMPFVEAEFLCVLTSPAAGLGGKLPSVWVAHGDPAQSLDHAQLAFQATVAQSTRPVVALVRFRFTDHPELGRRLAVAGVESWHGPLGLLPGVHPTGDCWRGMEAAALPALLAHLGLASDEPTS